MARRDFAATNAPGTCKWCGRKLRIYMLDAGKRERTEQWRAPSQCFNCPRDHYGTSGTTETTHTAPRRKPSEWELIENEIEHGAPVYRCKCCGNAQRAESKESRSKPKPNARLGDYGDGHFCGQSCGYQFAVAMANHGRTFQPQNQESTTHG